MLRSRILFGIWTVLVLLYYVATRSFLSAVFFLGTITLFLFAYVSVKKSKQGLLIDLLVPEMIKREKKKSFRISLENKSVYPIFSVKGVVVCTIENTGETEEIPFHTSVKAYMKEEVSLKVRSAKEGNLVLILKDVCIKDMFGIFVYYPEVSIEKTVQVLAEIEQTPEQENQQGERVDG